MAREKKSDPPPSVKDLSADDAVRLAEAVRKIATGMDTIRSAGRRRRALVVLLADSTKVSMRDINDVLNGLEQLGELYLEKK